MQKYKRIYLLQTRMHKRLASESSIVVHFMFVANCMKHLLRFIFMPVTKISTDECGYAVVLENDTLISVSVNRTRPNLCPFKGKIELQTVLYNSCNCKTTKRCVPEYQVYLCVGNNSVAYL